MAPRIGERPVTSKVESRSGAPAGGTHCSGPVPTDEEKSAFARKSMASAPSVIWVNGASRWAWTASPTEPAIEMLANAVSMASASGESAGPEPSGSPSLVENPLPMSDWICGPATELTMSPITNVSPSQMPEMNS